MDKQNVIKGIEYLIKAGELTDKELLDIYTRSMRTDPQEIVHKQSKISNILYFIGSAVVFLGICIFVGSNWSSLSDMTKILATLGAAAAMYGAGILLGRYENLVKVSDAFHIIANLVAPVGILVTMHVLNVDTNSAGSHAVAAAIVLSTNLLLYYMERRNVFYIFSVIFGTWLFFGFTTFMIGGRPFADWDFIKYRWLTAGLTHMALGYALTDTSKKNLTPPLYSFGVVEFLTAALCLGNWSPNQSIFWELVFPGLTFGILFLSVYLKSRSFLIFGTIYLMFYILKITNEYFTSGFGWSLSLILGGFALIGIGYLAFYLNQKYISR